MVKISNECVAAARTALSHFSDEELHEYATKVIRKSESEKISIQDAMKSVGDEKMQELFNRNATTAKNIAKFEKISDMIKSKETDMAALYVKRYKGLGYNVSESQRNAQHNLNENLFSKMSEEQVVYLKNVDNRTTILEALDGLDSPKLAKELAEHIRNYKEYSTAKLVESTALPIENIKKNRFLGNNHNLSKILKAGRNAIKAAGSKAKYTVEESKEIWRTHIKKNLDIKETFGGTKAERLDSSFDDKIVDEIINNTFENITTRKNEIFTRSLVANDREALERKAHQFYVFKDWRTWGSYDSLYGDNDLYSTLVGDIQISGNKVGTAEILGDSPYNTHMDLIKVQREAGLPKVPSVRLWERNVDLYFKEVMGANTSPESVGLANFTANLRVVSSMPRLLKLSVLSLNDSSRLGGQCARWGDNFWGSLGNDLSHSFNLFPTEIRKEAARMMSFSLRNEFGYLGRYIDAANASEALQKFSGGFYRKIGLTALDNGKKVSAISMMMSRLGRNADTKWGSLPEAFQGQLEKYMGEHEWELIRKYTGKVGREKVITFDSVKAIKDDELKELRRMTNSKLPLAEIRNDIERKVFSLFDIAAEDAVLAPGAFERAWLYQGTRPGTVEGSLLRMIGQFKTYPLAGIDRVYAQRFLDKDSAMSKVAWAAQMIAATSGMSYLINFFDYASQGLSMPDMGKMNASQKIVYSLSMMEPTFMLLYKMMDTNKQGKDMAVDMMNSPSLRMISNGVSTILGVPYGNFKPGKQLIKDAFPIHTLPIVGPYVDEMLGDKPYLQPGQKKLHWDY